MRPDSASDKALLAAYNIRNQAAFIGALESGASPDVSYNSTISLLNKSIQDQQFCLAEAMIDAGAKLDDPVHNTDFSYFVLSNAIICRAPAALVQKMIDKGARVGKTSRTGNKTPLHDAASYAEDSLVHLLLTNAADINAADTSGRTPLANAVARGRQALAFCMIDQHGADIHAVDNDGMSILYLAVAGNCPQLAKRLLKSGFDPNRTNKIGTTPLHMAVSTKKTATVEMLLSAGAKTDIRNCFGHTALFWTISCNWPEGLDLLIKAGADIHIRDKDGHTVLQQAVRSGSHEATEKLLTAGATFDNLTLFEKTLNGELADVLLSHGLPLSSFPPGDNTSLFYPVIEKWRARLAPADESDPPAIKMAKDGNARMAIDRFFDKTAQSLDTDKLLEEKDRFGNNLIDILGAHDKTGVLFDPSYWKHSQINAARELLQKIPPVYRPKARRGFETLRSFKNIERLERLTKPQAPRPQ